MKLNVIVIDDSKVQLAVSSKLINKNKILNLTGTYTDPFLALNAVNTQNIDVVLLDVEMPEINGLSLQKLFRNDVYVIVNSTRVRYELEAYLNGAIDFCLKPLSAEQLSSSFKRVVEMKGLQDFEKIGISENGSYLGI